MRFLIVFLLLSNVCSAEEFKSNKPVDAGMLYEEIEAGTGLNLEGQNQIGYISTSKDKIEIKLRDRKLTQDEKNKIDLIIRNHDMEKIKQLREAGRKERKEQIKIKLNFTEEDLQNLKEVLKD